LHSNHSSTIRVRKTLSKAGSRLTLKYYKVLRSTTIPSGLYLCSLAMCSSDLRGLVYYPHSIYSGQLYSYPKFMVNHS